MGLVECILRFFRDDLAGGGDSGSGRWLGEIGSGGGLREGSRGDLARLSSLKSGDSGRPR